MTTKSKKSSRRIAAFLAAVLIGTFALAACGQTPPAYSQRVSQDGSQRVLLDMDRMQRSDAENMELSTHLMDAVYEGVSENGLELIFKPQKVIRGELEAADQALIRVAPFFADDEIILESIDSMARECEQKAGLKTGESYMLWLEKYTSVYQEHNLYLLLPEFVVSETDEKWDEYHAMAERIVNEKGSRTEPARDFTTATDLSEIIDFATHILVVKVGEGERGMTGVTTSYECNVQQAVRNTPTSYEGIHITLFSDSVEVGEEYLMLLMGTDGSLVYTLAAPTGCVYTLTEAQKIPELAALLNP